MISSRTIYPKRHFAILAVIVAFLAALQVVASNQLIALDNRLEKARLTINTLEYEDNLIDQSIASSSSLLVVTQRARDLGFTETPIVLSLPRVYTVAQKLP